MLSVCASYETLPQGLANRFSRILSVVNKTWDKKRNSVLECYASPSYDVTSAGRDVVIIGLPTKSMSIPATDRISFFSLKLPEGCVIPTEPTIRYSSFQNKLTVLFSLNLQIVYSHWSRRGCGVAVMFVIWQWLMLEDCAVTLTSGTVWSAEIQEVSLSVRSGLLCV